MENSLISSGVIALAILILFATLSLAMRVPTRARIAAEFRKRGMAAALERYAATQSQYMLATSTIRTAAMLVLFWLTVLYFESTGLNRVQQGIAVMATSLALVLVFGVAIPNAWAKYLGEWLLVRCLPVLMVARIICYPIIRMLELFDPLVRRLAGVPVRDAESYAEELEREILDAVSEMERQGAVDGEVKEMIESVIELGDTLVQEVMTPRTEMVAVPQDANLRTVKDVIRTRGHSRIPVYDGTIDTVVGMIYAKDLLHAEEDGFDLSRVMRRVSFIPETKPLRALLKEFQEQKVHIAVVLDEYGGTAGLVTIEDILEELVGEIADEYDPAAPVPLKRIDEETVEVDARFRIDELNYELNIELPEDEDYETVGGFVFSKLGRIPKVGERCAHDNVNIQVIAAEPRRIRRVRVHIDAQATNGRGAQG